MYVYDYDQFGHTDRSDCFQPELKATQIVAFDANICIAANQKKTGTITINLGTPTDWIQI